MYIYIYYLYICFLIFNYMSLYKKSYRNNFLVSITIPAFFSCGNKQNQNSDKGITVENIASKDSATKESFLKSLGVPTEAIDKDGKYKAPEVTLKDIKENRELAEKYLKNLGVPTEAIDEDGKYKAPEVDKEKLIDNFIDDKNLRSILVEKISENPELNKSILKESHVPLSFINNDGKFILFETEIISLLINAIEQKDYVLLEAVIDILKNKEIDIKCEDLLFYMKTFFSNIYKNPNELMLDYNILKNKTISISIKDNKKIEISLNSLTYESIYKYKLIDKMFSFEKKKTDVNNIIIKLNTALFFSDKELKTKITNQNQIAEILKDHYNINSDDTFTINENGYQHLNKTVSRFTYSKVFSRENNSIKVENQIIYNPESKNSENGPFYSKKF